MKGVLQQRGYGLLVTLLFLLVIMASYLNYLHRQLLDAKKNLLDEHFYIQAYHQAQSALEWGMSYRWPTLTRNWQCNQPLNAEFKTCSRQTAQLNVLILKGESQLMIGNEPINLYRLIYRQPNQDEDEPLINFTNGWLDFCPLMDNIEC